MLTQESKSRQNELIKTLKEMACKCMDEDEVKSVLIKLKAIYTEGFRHDYSEFFPLIVECAKDENNYDLDYLSNNIQMARDLVEQDYVNDEQEFKGLYKPLLKLSAHINLEIGRYNYYSIGEHQVKDLQSKLKDATEKLAVATTKLENAQKTVGSVQTELIAVLSIFAAIVLTFAGGMNILGNALSGMQNAPFFKSMFFVLLCGFIICNAIFLMMYIVGKITGRNIYARCKSEDCTCGANSEPKCWGLKRVRKRLPYIYWLNFFVVLLMIVDVVVWYLDKLWNIIP